jgi:RsiW-degrading membrane proteinase PrsW (M82 family)
MEPGQGRLLVAVGFALAVALHGVFNYLVSDTITMVVLVFLLVPIAWIAASRTIEGALRDGYRP